MKCGRVQNVNGSLNERSFLILVLLRSWLHGVVWTVCETDLGQSRWPVKLLQLFRMYQISFRRQICQHIDKTFEQTNNIYQVAPAMRSLSKAPSIQQRCIVNVFIAFVAILFSTMHPGERVCVPYCCTTRFHMMHSCIIQVIFCMRKCTWNINAYPASCFKYRNGVFRQRHKSIKYM